MEGQAQIRIEAPPDRVYALVSDVTNMGRWSSEAYRCVWLDDATGPAEGARFRGYNRKGPLRWRTTARVTEAEPGRAFAFEVLPFLNRVQTRWRYDLTAAGDETLLRESFQVLWLSPFTLLFGGKRRRQEQLERSLRQTLERIKAASEGHDPAGSPFGERAG